jgi:hypothetical protein
MSSKRIAGIASAVLMAIGLAACDINWYFYYLNGPSGAGASSVASTTTNTTTSGTTGGGGAGTTSSSGGGGTGGTTSSSGTGGVGGATSSSGAGGTCMPATMAPTVAWANVANGTGRAFAITTDPAGYVLASGSFSTSINFGASTLMTSAAGDVDLFVARFDLDGAPLSPLSFGDAGTTVTNSSLAIDSTGNLVLTGTYTGSMDFGGGPLMSVGPADMFIASLHPDDTYGWAISVNMMGATTATSIAVDSSGNVIATGNFDGSVHIGSKDLTDQGQGAVFVAKLTQQTGFPVWVTPFGGQGTANIAASSTAVDSDGNVFVTGSFSGSVTVGVVPLMNAGIQETFVAKLDPQGNCMWASPLGNGSQSFGTAVTVDDAGYTIVAGVWSGMVDLGCGPIGADTGAEEPIIAKLDPGGVCVWSHLLDGNPSGWAEGLATDGNRNVLVTGAFIGPVDFGCGPLMNSGPGPDVFITELDVSGKTMWTQQFVTEGIGNGVAVDTMGNAYVTGDFSGSIDFGAGPIVGSGQDVFVAKISP